MVSRRQLLWGAVAAALLLALGSAFAEGGFRRYYRLAGDQQQLKDRNERLAQENAKLRREIEGLRDDPRAMEQAAREELGFIRPGELVFNVEAP